MIDFRHPVAQKYYQKKQSDREFDSLYDPALEACKEANRWSVKYICKKMRVGTARGKKILMQFEREGHRPAPAPKAPPAAAPLPAPAPAQVAPPTPWGNEAEVIEVPDDIGELGDLPLRDLVAKFGTAAHFKIWLTALKEIEAINEKRIKNAQSQGKLVSRTLVETGVIDPINAAHIKIMTDGAKAITAAAESKFKAGVSAHDVEAYVADVIGSHIRPLKARIQRNLDVSEN